MTSRVPLYLNSLGEGQQFESSDYVSLANGGIGLNASSASNGQLLIGNGSGFTLATLTSGGTIAYTTGSGSLSLDITSSVVLAGSPTTTTQASTDNSTKIATTAYVTTAVSNALAGVNPATSVAAATNAICPNSPTYNNGVSGVGATITDGGQHVLVIDGYTALLNDRILVKNEASGGGLGAADNGIYVVTTLGVSSTTPWVMTRASDFNSSSNINNTGLIPVINGTANSGTAWLLTTKVTNVGADALTFSEFSSGGGGGGSGTVTSVTFTGDGTVLSSTPSSAVTTSGTLTASLNTTSAYTVLGNNTGSTAAPSYVSLSAAMMPSTSVNSTGNLSPLFTSSISSQALSFSLSNAGGYTVLGNTSGSTGAPSYVSLTAAMLPSTTVNSIGNLSPLFTASISTQAASFSLSNAGAGTVFGNFSGSTGAPSYNAPGTADQILGAAHTGGGLEYKTIAAGSNITVTPTAGTITIASTGGGVTLGQVVAVGMNNFGF